MNKAEFTEAVMSKVNDGDVKNKAAADRIIDAVFDVIKNEVANGETVTIVNFGTFKAVDKAERETLSTLRQKKNAQRLQRKRLSSFPERASRTL